MTIEERIAQRIAEIEADREKFIQDVTRQVNVYNLMLGELKRLIEPVEETVNNDPTTPN